MTHAMRIVLLALLSACFTSCIVKKNMGYLHVHAPNSGAFEIYRIAHTQPLQFNSEQLGQFNQDIPLAPGSYFVLSDCSSETVIIYPEQKVELTAHAVNFKPPTTPNSEDLFSVQCDRFIETKTKQHIINRYSLNVLSGQRDLLVAMVPLQINLTNEKDMAPRTMEFQLSGIKVHDYPGVDPESRFFVSPASGQIAVTTHQKFGHWQYVLPGRYMLEVNGTQMDVEVSPEQLLAVTPAQLRISSPKNVDLETISQVSGDTVFVELNQGHLLMLNETYPVLPGTATLKLQGSLNEHSVVLMEGELTEKSTRAVKVHNDCPFWDWTCLGNLGVFLFEKDKASPFAHSMTDIPILYFENDVQIGIEGSKDIRYNIAKDKDYEEFYLGTVTFVPKAQHRSGQLTDLSRVEASDSSTHGFTLDLVYDQPTTMSLIAGTYQFAQYTLFTAVDGERRSQKKQFQVKAGEQIQIPFVVLVSEKKANALVQQEAQQKQQDMRRMKTTYQNHYLPFNRLRFF